MNDLNSQHIVSFTKLICNRTVSLTSPLTLKPNFVQYQISKGKLHARVANACRIHTETIKGVVPPCGDSSASTRVSCMLFHFWSNLHGLFLLSDLHLSCIKNKWIDHNGLSYKAIYKGTKFRYIYLGRICMTCSSCFISPSH